MNSSPIKRGFTAEIVRVFITSKLSMLLLIASLLAGMAALLLTPREEEPQIIVPMADVFVNMPGASAEEVEKLVASPLEAKLREVDGVEYVYSTSREGEAMVTVRFFVGEDREDSLVKVWNKLMSNRDVIPPGVRDWTVKPVEIDDVPILTLALSSNNPVYDTAALRRLADEIKDKLGEVEDSGKIAVVGGELRRILVYPDAAKLAARGLTLPELMQALEAANVNLRAGRFDAGNQSVQLDAGPNYHHVDEVAATVVKAEGGRPVYLRAETALDATTPLIHPELGDNLCFKRELDTGGVDEAFAREDAVVFEETYVFGRHTGVTLEPRCQIADWQAGHTLAQGKLTVYHSFQAPHMMQDLYCRQFDLHEGQVRVICRDVGGSFGIKVHAYPDDFATVALAMMLGRPVKFVADRLESFVSDIHAREHRIRARIAASQAGEILAFEIDDLTGIGPFSMFPRTSGIEGNQVVNLTGGPYKHKAYRAKLKVVFQNKVPTCQYRGVGHPIACAVTEALVDGVAAKLGMDPIELRQCNVIPDDAYPATGASGIKLEVLSHEACLREARRVCDYDALRAEQKALRVAGVHRGIGVAALIELTNPSAAFYGVGGARIASQDGATIRLEPTGVITVSSSVGEQGQGAEAIFAQIAADAVGVDIHRVRVVTGDTDTTPYGGGTWASRGAGIGGEAVLQAGRVLRENMLATAEAILKRERQGLRVFRGAIVDGASGETLLDLAELGRIAYFRSDTLPKDFTPELMVTRHYAQRDYPFIFTNGVQVSHVEVDTDTGFVKLLKHWAVEDCGRVINPMLVDEQMRGAIVQGIGGALFEECLYDSDGTLRNGNMADYLVPMAGEMPDIVVSHVQSPTRSSMLGAKGAGEAGTAGAPGAVMNAINDALAPFGARVSSQPITPEKILRALGKI